MELPGRNKHNKLLIGVIYRSDLLMTASYWLECFEDLLSHITSTWDGMVVRTGDINFDLIGRLDSLVTRYINTLDMFGLEQIVTKPTRVTRTSRTLIYYIITNYPMRISVTDVIPTSIVSDHDAPFACINVRVNRYQPRYKYIRNMKTFDEQEFISDLNTLPLNIVYSSDDPEEQLDRQHPGWTTAKYGHYNSCEINSGRKPTRLAPRSPGNFFGTSETS